VSNPHIERSQTNLFVRAIRFLLLLLMLAVMPFQSWAGAGVCAVGNAASHGWAQPDSSGTAAQATQDAAYAAVDNRDCTDAAAASIAADPDEAPGSADLGDPSQPGADLAESLLPASPLRFVAGLAGSGAPAHRAGALPDPDLPLQQRPPSA
jgi:hypothetical protein